MCELHGERGREWENVDSGERGQEQKKVEEKSCDRIKGGGGGLVL